MARALHDGQGSGVATISILTARKAVGRGNHGGRRMNSVRWLRIDPFKDSSSEEGIVALIGGFQLSEVADECPFLGRWN